MKLKRPESSGDAPVLQPTIMAAGSGTAQLSDLRFGSGRLRWNGENCERGFRSSCLGQGLPGSDCKALLGQKLRLVRLDVPWFCDV